MKFLVILILFLVSCSSAFSQKVDYSLPKPYRHYISKKEYRELIEFTFRQLEGVDVLSLEKGTIRMEMNGYPYQLSVLPFLQQRTILSQPELQSTIHDHVSSLVEAYHDQQMLTQADFSTIKKYLRLRLYSQEAMSEEDRTFWLTRSDLEGTLTAVVMELPTAVATVSIQQLELWGVDREETFSIATENSARQTFEVHHQTLGKNRELIAIGSRQDAANATLFLEQVMPEPISAQGAIIAVPHRDMVLVYNLPDEPIDSLEKFIKQLHSLVLEQHQQHQQPVSPFFYWYHRGKFARIRLGKDPDGNLHIFPPSALRWFSSN